MKKASYKLTLIISIIFLTGCMAGFPILSEKKPNNYYYTNLLVKDIKLNSAVSCKVVEMNYYRELAVTGENYKKVCSSFDKLSGSSFIQAPKDLPSRPKFKLIFSCSKDKYIVNVYSSRYVSVSPWDGPYEMDYIDISTLPASVNLYELCNFLYSL